VLGQPQTTISTTQGRTYLHVPASQSGAGLVALQAMPGPAWTVLDLLVIFHRLSIEMGIEPEQSRKITRTESVTLN
jgi:hypothetical protein